MSSTGVAITNPLVLYRSLIATQKIRPDPAQHRLGMTSTILILAKPFGYMWTDLNALQRYTYRNSTIASLIMNRL